MKGIHRINPCICVSWEQIPEEAERCSIWTRQSLLSRAQQIAPAAGVSASCQITGDLSRNLALKDPTPSVYLMCFPSCFSPLSWSITIQVTNVGPELMNLILTKGKKGNCELGHSRAEYSCASLELFQKCVEMEDRHLRKQKFRLNFSLHKF